MVLLTIFTISYATIKNTVTAKYGRLLLLYHENNRESRINENLCKKLVYIYEKETKKPESLVTFSSNNIGECI